MMHCSAFFSTLIEHFFLNLISIIVESMQMSCFQIEKLRIMIATPDINKQDWIVHNFSGGIEGTKLDARSCCRYMAE